MAMTDTYPIIELQTDWLLGDEQMGSKDKFWVRLPSDSNPWLFKYSRVSAGRIPGEHWAEKIAAEVYVKAIVPTKLLVEKFCAIATPIYEQVDLLFRQIQNLRRTRDLLLPRLLSGQVELETQAA